MKNDLQDMLSEIRIFENAIIKKLIEKEKALLAPLKSNFSEGSTKLHVSSFKFLIESSFTTILTVPFIYFLILPAFFLDISVSLYQLVCFPIYKISKVDRKKYILFDRQNLPYLNSIEKFNCIYCTYFNGLLAWISEVAARTEQYWCPIKHMAPPQNAHTRYGSFSRYENEKEYRQKLDALRLELSKL